MCVRTRECVLVCERVLATGGGSLMEWFFYQRHVNAVPREGHQALPKSRRGREREGKGKGEDREREREKEEEGGLVFQKPFIERGWQIL